jgi:hypothetical protein
MFVLALDVDLRDFGGEVSFGLKIPLFVLVGWNGRAASIDTWSILGAPPYPQMNTVSFILVPMNCVKKRVS